MEFIVGILCATTIIIILYGLGVFWLKIMDEYDDMKHEGIFIMCLHGMLLLWVLGMVGCFITLILFLGRYIINLF